MAEDFEKAVADFALVFEEQTERVVKNTVISLYGAIIKASPVKTGRFRANWFLGDIVASNLETKDTDKSGQKTIKKMTSGVNAVAGLPPEFSLTNNLPYSEVIEFGEYPNPVDKGTKISKKGEEAKYFKFSDGGFSKKAPHGVVRVNVTRFEKLLEKEAERLKYGNI